MSGCLWCEHDDDPRGALNSGGWCYRCGAHHDLDGDQRDDGTWVPLLHLLAPGTRSMRADNNESLLCLERDTLRRVIALLGPDSAITRDAEEVLRALGGAV